jgi:hypothetical protein
VVVWVVAVAAVAAAVVDVAVAADLAGNQTAALSFDANRKLAGKRIELWGAAVAAPRVKIFKPGEEYGRPRTTVF